MDKWSFNSLLFGRLTDVLDISVTEMAKRCHVRQQVLNRYMKNENELPVKILIKMCNALRMPCHFFVSEYNNHDVPNREIATISAEQWQPIEWDNQAVEHTFGDGEGRIFWKDVAVVMGVTAQKPHDRFLLRKRFPVTDFLVVCNHFNLSPFNFLVDQNRDGSGKKGKGIRSTAHPPAMLAEISALRDDVDRLARTAADLTEKYRDIAARYDDLLADHKLLLRRFNEYLADTAAPISIAADTGVDG